MTRTFKIWLASFLAIALFTPISVLWLDRPIALIHDMFGSRQIAGDLGRSPILSISLVSDSFFYCGLSAIMGRKFSKFETVILLCDISVLAVYAAKDELKFLFGRTWPESWGPNVTSLIRDNAYPASHLNHFPPAMPPCLLLLYSVL